MDHEKESEECRRGILFIPWALISISWSLVNLRGIFPDASKLSPVRFFVYRGILYPCAILSVFLPQATSIAFINRQQMRFLEPYGLGMQNWGLISIGMFAITVIFAVLLIRLEIDS